MLWAQGYPTQLPANPSQASASFPASQAPARNPAITIEGGVWDGGFGREFNRKSGDIFEIGSTSGACLNFVTVKGLRLLDMTITNPVAYYIRLGRVRDFVIRDIRFASELPGNNQDGIHFRG